MSRFAPALRRLARELEMPSGARSAFLLEVASDLEAVFEHHRARGASEGEAMRRAEEAVLGSSEVLRRMSRLHRGAWQGWADAVAERVAGGFERILLVGGVLPAALLGVGVAVWTLRAGESGVVWGLLAVGAGMARVGISGFVRLRRGVHVGAAGGPALVVLSAMAAALGFLALTLGLQAVGAAIASQGAGVESMSLADGQEFVGPGSSADFADRAAIAPLGREAVLADRLARDAAVFVAGLLVGLAGLLSWFALVGGEARRVTREVEAVLGDGARLGPEPVAIPLVRRRPS